MINSNPVISVIIPVYNGEKFLAEAVQSVLAQNYPSLEIIIVDDGSTDNTRKICDNYKHLIKYLYQDNAGPSSARNMGLSLATGEFISFLDVDDLWPVNKLKDHLAEFKKNPSLGFVQGFTEQVYYRKYNPDLSKISKKEEIIFGFLLGSGLYRKSIFDKVGNFDTGMKFCEDLDWFLRAREEEIPFKVQEKLTLIYRIHGENLTHDEIQTAPYPLIAFKKSKRKYPFYKTTTQRRSCFWA
jgi:glycosyltransferase involved in cell wall biosynthesis